MIYSRGALKDATGRFHAGLLGLVCMTLLRAVLIRLLRRQLQRTDQA